MLPLTPSILIIDDDCNSSELIEVMLHHSDTKYEVTCVQTPEEGLRLAATQRFDLYLLDHRLPGMSGVEVCRALRRMNVNAPVVFFTGSAYEPEQLEAMQAGATAYLIKPDDLGKITETVKRLTGGSKPAATRGVPLPAYPSGVSV